MMHFNYCPCCGKPNNGNGGYFYPYLPTYPIWYSATNTTTTNSGTVNLSEGSK